MLVCRGYASCFANKVFQGAQTWQRGEVLFEGVLPAMGTIGVYWVVNGYYCCLSPGFFDEAFIFIKKAVPASDLTFVIDGREFVPFGYVPLRIDHNENHVLANVYLGDGAAVFRQKGILSK